MLKVLQTIAQYGQREMHCGDSSSGAGMATPSAAEILSLAAVECYADGNGGRWVN